MAHRAGARIFRCIKPSEGLLLLKTIENPRGRLRERQINSDKPGRHAGSRSPNRHGMSPHEDAEERVAADFARQLAEEINHERALRHFTNLILVGPPKFTSIIRSHLAKKCQEGLVGTLNKNLWLADPVEIAQYADPLLREAYRERAYELRTAV